MTPFSPLKITLNGIPLKVDPGTRIERLLEEHPHPGPFPALGALMNNRPVGLSYELVSNATLQTLDLSSREGMDIYRRTASTLLYAALRKIAPTATVTVGQSIGAGGYFFEIEGEKIDARFISRLNEEMQRIAKEDFPVIVERTTSDDAISRLSALELHDQTKLVGQSRYTEVVLAHLGDYTGLLHGPIASRAGVIDRFRLSPFHHGLLLDFPDEAGNLPETANQHDKLFSTYIETKRWNKLVSVETIADLNEHSMRGELPDLIHITEALHEKKIAAIADQIAFNKDIQLILIAGPSSSGKTTFAHRLRIHLLVHGIDPVSISIDNYYRPREEAPRHSDGTFDFESPDALDVPLLNEHLDRLIHGDVVDTPVFSFDLGKQHPLKKNRLQLKPGQVLMTEGIHGINDAFSKSVPRFQKFKIYVSALTQLCIDQHNRIFTTDTRLCRRIVRDRLFRGCSAADTISLWPSVRHGEINYIFPFEEEADVVFNSALIYEHSLLKPFAERFLMEVPRDHTSFREANRLARFFSYFIPVLPDEVPRTSIIREFIGGSAFQYG